MKYQIGDRVRLGVITEYEDFRGTPGTVVSAVSAHEYPYGIELDYSVSGRWYLLCLEGELESENEAIIRELRQEVSDLRMERDGFDRENAKLVSDYAGVYIQYKEMLKRAEQYGEGWRSERPRALNAERRAASWWEAAKNLIRERNALAWDSDNLRHENSRLDDEISEMVQIVEEASKRAEKAERLLEKNIDAAQKLAEERDTHKELREKADSEVRSHDDEIRSWVERATRAEQDLSYEKGVSQSFAERFENVSLKYLELKKALRTLSED